MQSGAFSRLRLIRRDEASQRRIMNTNKSRGLMTSAESILNGRLELVISLDAGAEPSYLVHL
jgi:hypothetical protein